MEEISELEASAVHEATAEVQSRRQRRSQAWSILAIITFLFLASLFWISQRNSSEVNDASMPLGGAAGSSDSISEESSATNSDSSASTDAGSSSSSASTCQDVTYQCITDRMGHWTHLPAGSALCNAQYRFGITQEGVFQWHNCETDENRIIYDAPAENTTLGYFQMTDVGAIEIYDDADSIIFQKDPTLTISPTKQCLSSPKLDCPYLHLHKSGDVVLNSIGENGWSDRKIQKCFDNLWN